MSGLPLLRLIGLALLLAACAGAESGTPTPLSSPTDPAAPTPSSPLSTPGANQTLAATPTGPNAAVTLTNTPTPRPSVPPPNSATPTPTLAPPALLAAMTLRDAGGLPGLPLRRTGEFAGGLRSAGYCRHGPYRWLDSEHLLVLPVVEQAVEPEEGGYQGTQPVVIGFGPAAPWLAGSVERGCQVPLWSEGLQRLIGASAGQVRQWDLTGQLGATYPGQAPLHLAPSGLRLLAANRWIDLERGEDVLLGGLRPIGPHVPAWSADERQVFGCCFYYANVDTGQRWERSEFPGFFIGGRGSWPGEETWSISRWLPGDQGVVIETLAIWFLTTDNGAWVAPLIDPLAESYQDLIEVLALGTPPACQLIPAPRGPYAWLGCLDQQGGRVLHHDPAYLVSVSAGTAQEVPGSLEFLSWSPDGGYAAFNELAGADAVLGSAWVTDLSGARRQMAPARARQAHWHPTEPLVALLFEDRRVAVFYHAASGVRRSLALEEAITDFAWHPGRGAAALATESGQLLWLPNVFDQTVAPMPIAPAQPGLHTLRWSPDGRRLAFVAETRLFVVEGLPE
jgi:hypothetical protein